MAHPEQQEYCKSVRNKFPEYFKDVFILDIGSLDINGNNRYLFDSSSVYIGIDVALGPNVDFASSGHELAVPDETFDVVISTECLEHDRYWQRTLQNAIRMLRPGGMLLMTCATTDRPEHGTRRTSPENAPLLSEVDDDWADYYRNLDESDVRASIKIDEFFKFAEFSVNKQSCDLYFVGIKKGIFVKNKNNIIKIDKNLLNIEVSEMKNSLSANLKISNPKNIDIDLRYEVNVLEINEILSSKKFDKDHLIEEKLTLNHGEHYYRNSPVLFDDEYADELAGKMFSSHYQKEIYFGSIKIYQLENAILTGTDQIVTAGKALLSETAFEYFNFDGEPQNFTKTKEKKFFHSPKNTKIIEEPCVLIKNLTEPQNYGHFLVEAGASFSLAREFVYQENLAVILRKTYDMKMREVIYANLRIISQGQSLNFYERDKDDAWIVKKLYYITPVHVPPYKSRYAITHLRESILNSGLIKKENNDKNKARIYISRKFSGTRKIINEEEIYAFLKKYGFSRVFLDDLSFEEKLSYFKNSEIVVGPKGAGLANCMFMPEGSTLLVLSPGDFEDPFFYDLASHANVKYAEIFCPVEETPNRGRGFRNFFVPIKKLQNALQVLIPSNHSNSRVTKKNDIEISAEWLFSMGSKSTMKTMLLCLEGLGNNCEFGIVQRHFSCDPPGLFRNVGFLSPDTIINAIEHDLEGLFDDGNYDFTLPEGWKDWRIDSQGLMFHAGIPADITLDSEDWTRKSREALQAHRLLKRMFREELRKGEKIFVYRQKQIIALDDVRRLHAAIRKYGPGWLLNVVEDPSKPKGTIEDLGDGLIIATTSVLSNEDPPNIDLAAWELITRKVLALKEQAKSPQA